MHEEATDPVEAITQLRHTLAISEQSRASDLWVRLVTFAREGAGRSEEFNRLTLLAKFAGEYRFSGASSMKADLDQLTQLTQLWIEDITSEIDDFQVMRHNLLEETNELLTSHRFIQIKGLPGTGKSALLKEIVQSKLNNGTVLFLKSDRLIGNSWAAFAKNIGLATQNIEILLAEIAVTGTPTLFIDGIDRIQPTHRKIVLDLVNAIMNSSVTCAELKEELPEDIQERWKTERHSMPFSQPEFSYHDWDHLSIGRSQQGFFPASPLREPFNSLFNSSSQQALELIRDLLNHAMTAWLQLHKLSHENRGTPIPVVIEFPWGQQAFWGDWPEYGWFRGWFGSEVAQCALMALENWAFHEIEGGRDVDSVLHDVIEGHTCWAVLGIAIAIMLETQHVSKTTLAILACQRLWHVDLRRQLEEHPNIPSNLIGFTGINGQERTDKLHFEAVKTANGRKCRRMSLRDLTPLFILNHDEDIRQVTCEALARFPVDQKLPMFIDKFLVPPFEIRPGGKEEGYVILQGYFNHNPSENITLSAFTPHGKFDTNIQLNKVEEVDLFSEYHLRTRVTTKEQGAQGPAGSKEP